MDFVSKRDIVFVSYSQDDKPYRIELEQHLKPLVPYWSDPQIRPGEEYRTAIDVAIANARAAVLLVSPSYLSSNFIMEREVPQLIAAERAGRLELCLIAVRASVYKHTVLEAFQFIHNPARPLDGLSDSERGAELAGIAGQIRALLRDARPPSATMGPLFATLKPLERAVPGTLGPLCGVPQLPQPFTSRPEELGKLKCAVLEGSQAAVGIVGVQGLGGVGKTVLAIACARDEDVRRAFPDGVYFLSFGQTPAVSRVQNELAERLGVETADSTDPLARRDVFRRVLRDKACLLVLDDLWQREHALLFDVVGSSGRVLITTRDAQLALALGAADQHLGPLDTPSALDMLADNCGWDRAKLPSAASELARECGNLPLALAVAGRTVKGGQSFEQVLSALKEFAPQFRNHPYAGVWKSLGTSVQALDEGDAARYRELAVVPEDTVMPTAVVARLWNHTAGLSSQSSHELLERLSAKNLLDLDTADGERVVRFHDLQLDYLHLVEAHRAADHHSQLLDAFGAVLSRLQNGNVRWSVLPKSESYMWKHLCHHLVEATRLEQLRSLAIDSAWLEAKIAASGVSELLLELARIAERTPCAEVTLVERAIRAESGWLYRDPEALPGLLYNRLRSLGTESATRLELSRTLRPLVRLLHPVDMGVSERLILRGHSGAITVCSYSPDETRILSASEDGTIREWDARNGSELRRYTGHTAKVSACRYDRAGTRVLSGSADRSIREWDVSTGRELRRFEEAKGAITMCMYNPTETRVLAASSDRSVCEWDARSGRKLRRFKSTLLDSFSAFNAYACDACMYSPDGSRVMGYRQVVFEWSVQTGTILNQFAGHRGNVRLAAYSPDGTRVLSGADDLTLAEWDAREVASPWPRWRMLRGTPTLVFRELQRFKGHTRRITACLYNSDQTRVLSGAWDSTVREWDTKSGEELRCLKGHSSGVSVLAYSPNGTRAVSGSWDATIREWDLSANTSTELQLIKGHARPITCCTYNSKGSRILSGSEDGTIREWDAGRSQGASARWHSAAVQACGFGRDATTVFSVSLDRTIREWDLREGSELRCVEVPARNLDPFLRVAGMTWVEHRCIEEAEETVQRDADSLLAFALHPDRSRVLIAEHPGVLHEHDAATGVMLRKLAAHTDWITTCQYSPDAQHVLTGSLDGTVRIWDVQTGLQLLRLDCVDPNRQYRVMQGIACAYSPDGLRVLARSEGALAEWDARTGTQLRRFVGVSDATVCGYRPDGLRVVSGSTDGVIREWDARTGSELRRLHGHAGPINACVYNVDSTLLYTCSEDHTVRIWQLAHGRLLHTVYGVSAFRSLAVENGAFIAGDASGNLWIFDWRHGLDS